MKRSFPVLLILFGLTVGCAPSNPPSDAGTPDASAPDAGHDGGVDAGHDGGLDAGPDAGADAGPDAGLDGGFTSPFCQLAGSYVYDAQGNQTLVGTSPVDLSWLKLPPGFCVHYFGNVGDARQLRFAPGGELFVSSPTQSTTGGNASAGKAAIIVLADDNYDGYADKPTTTFMSNLPQTQGIMFANNSFYYQDQTKVMKMPYALHQRTGNPSTATPIIDITTYESTGHWPKTFDMADDGTIYVSNGGDQGEYCLDPMPFHGGIWQVDGTTGGMPIVKGLRNPIALKCEHRHDHCFALELGQDYSQSTPGAEKLLLIHPGDNWGYPCCADRNLPYIAAVAYQNVNGMPGSSMGTPDCSQTTPTTNAFEIAETPFGLDFEPGNWPAPWTGRVFIALHGVFGSWQGARVVAIKTDPATGLPLPSSDLDGGTPAAMSDFATGWDDGLMDHGRPADVTIAPDGRLFLANDVSGDIVWIAPVQ